MPVNVRTIAALAALTLGSTGFVSSFAAAAADSSLSSSSSNGQHSSEIGDGGSFVEKPPALRLSSLDRRGGSGLLKASSVMGKDKALEADTNQINNKNNKYGEHNNKNMKKKSSVSSGAEELLKRFVKRYSGTAAKLSSSSSPTVSGGGGNSNNNNNTDPSATPPLPFLSIDPNSITVSGFDSGAIFANQFQIAHSSIIKAAGLVSGVPYLCSEGTLIGASACMENPLAIINSALITQTLFFQGLGLVDPLLNLADQYTLVFGAPFDPVVSHLSTERMVQLLTSLGANHVETFYNYSSAGHAWVTDSDGNNPCGYTGTPYINDCGLAFGNVFLERAYKFLQIPTTPLRPQPPTPSRDNNNNSTDDNNSTNGLPELVLFSQTIYGADPTDNSMDSAGYAFIPPQCYAKLVNNTDSDNSSSTTQPAINVTMCRLHVHFHGCDQSRSTMGAGYVTRTGLNTQWAVDNNIVIIYPQAAPNALKYNPLGCWDWFNYNNENFYTNWGEYASKKGVQIRIVMQIINSALSTVRD